MANRIDGEGFRVNQVVWPVMRFDDSASSSLWQKHLLKTTVDGLGAWGIFQGQYCSLWMGPCPMAIATWFRNTANFQRCPNNPPSLGGTGYILLQESW